MHLRALTLLLALSIALPAGARTGPRLRQRVSQLAGRAKQLWSRARQGGRDRITRVRISHRTVGDWSTASLLMSSANNVVRLGGAAGKLAPHLAGFGSVGLGIYSLRDLARAKTAVERVEATHGVAWSLQGLAGLGRVFRSRATWIAPTAKTLGVAGGALQAGVGSYRLAQGVRGLRRGTETRKNRSRVVLGLVDLGAGSCWAASACGVAAPYTLGGFIVLTAARMAYSHRDALGRAARKLTAPLRRSGDTTVIVTAPTTPEVAARALQGPGTASIHDGNGRTALLTPATVKTSRGVEKPALVVTPVRNAP